MNKKRIETITTTLICTYERNQQSQASWYGTLTEEEEKDKNFLFDSTETLVFKRFWSFPELGIDPNRGRALVDRVQGERHREKGREREDERETRTRNAEKIE